MPVRNMLHDPLDSLIRRIVREEIRTMFTMSEDEELDVPSALNAAADSKRFAGATAGKRRKSKAAKGRVTNPATDKRLKANRESNA